MNLYFVEKKNTILRTYETQDFITKFLQKKVKQKGND